MSDCRSCHRPIRWALTAKGKRIPLDPQPVDDGNITLTGDPANPVASVHGHAPLLFDDEPRYVSHFATCPDAERHRKR